MYAASRHGIPSLMSFPKDGEVNCEVRPPRSPIHPYIKSSEFPRNSEENSRKKIRAFRENLGILRTRKMCKNPRKARTLAGPRIPRKLGKLGQISSHEKLGQFSEDS